MNSKSDPPSFNISSYRTYLKERLCWIDGAPTHASSASQRQCPKCRVKWSYTHAALEFAIFEEFCKGDSASHVAQRLSCSRNTVMAHYRVLIPIMEDIVANMLLDGKIATNPQSIEELIRLEKALRVGSRKRKFAACRYLFLNSLDEAERAERLFLESISRSVQLRVQMAIRAVTFQESLERINVDSIRRFSAGAPLFLFKNYLNKITKRSFDRLIFKNIPLLMWLYPSALPSPACRKLGKKWVAVWKTCREIVKKTRAKT